jgi:hypothetical protein
MAEKGAFFNRLLELSNQIPLKAAGIFSRKDAETSA